jgi:hypothetical protein
MTEVKKELGAVVLMSTTLGATTGTLTLWADSPNPEVAPPAPVFTISGTYASQVAATASAWAKDTATNPPYNYKSTLTFTAQNLTGWPSGADGSASVAVKDGTFGATIGTVSVTLTGKHAYSLPITAVTLTAN